jgi:hypothetical protein
MPRQSKREQLIASIDKRLQEMAPEHCKTIEEAVRKVEILWHDDPEGLQDEVNEWVAAQGTMIEIVTTHYAAATASAPNYAGAIVQFVRYTVAIFYREL